MILQKSRNKVSPENEPYLIINIVFAGVILLVMLYSGFFSPVKDNYPVTCVHEKITGEPCASCGLSHSFSLIVRGNFSEAVEWNVYGLRVFLFFALQLVLRIAFSMFYIKYPQTRRQLIVVDSVGSGIMLLIAFGPFMSWIIGNTF